MSITTGVLLAILFGTNAYLLWALEMQKKINREIATFSIINSHILDEIVKVINQLKQDNKNQEQNENQATDQKIAPASGDTELC